MSNEIELPERRDGKTLEETCSEIQRQYGNPSPERIERAKHRLEEWEKERLAEKLQQLRASWGAPNRALAVKTLRTDGAWGETLEKIKSRLGTGFLIGMIGGRGPGKTQMGVELMKFHTGNLKSAQYSTATEFFMKVKQTYKSGSEDSEFDVIKEFRKKSFLVLDETGKRGETDWENRLLFELIDKRYQDMSDTLMISNENQPEFIASIGPSLASRMQETGGIIQCNWPSFRA